MLTYVSGGAASGKSAFAEKLALQKDMDSLFYVATMDPDGPEAQERIRKHRKARSGKNFVTLERKSCLSDLKIPPYSGRSLILLEDLGNLVANEQFDAGGSDEKILERVRADIDALCGRVQEVIVVGDDIFSDDGDYPEETLRYMRLLAESARYAAGIADSVWEVVFGIALPLKGAGD